MHTCTAADHELANVLHTRKSKRVAHGRVNQRSTAPFLDYSLVNMVHTAAFINVVPRLLYVVLRLFQVNLHVNMYSVYKRNTATFPSKRYS